ncbi:MAG: hypothetical protein H7A45_11355 [Verrucomicrobiales bacterium]|nr:hypothetical protein [Verrucomicrobiales bacterium]MCP5526039.1 hypothetical protein [Verrucomicrobiales bacterium]
MHPTASGEPPAWPVEQRPSVTPPVHPKPGSQTDTCAVLLLLTVAILSAVRWSWYPVFIDTYYHMATIHGMEQAGGLPTWAFWEMAPAGRVHIYPPSMHLLGYLLTFLGVPPDACITFLSWLLYPALMLTTWIWIRQVFGSRPALIAVVLLCGPGTLFWNQTSFNAVAFATVLAPLALLALEKERFLICAVINLIATTAHPMGLFLPPALVINTVLRGKRLWPGLLASGLPVLLYSPWLLHIWANRNYLPEERTGGEVSLSGIGAGTGLNLGLALGVAALIGLGVALVRRRQAFTLIGPLLGCGVVFAMGFGRRFLQYNLHWPLACLGAVGAGWLLDRLEHGGGRQMRIARAASLGLAFLTLATWVAIEVPMDRQPIGGAPGGTNRRGGGPLDGAAGTEPRRSWFVSAQPSAIARLLDPATQVMEFGAMGGGRGRPGAPRGGNRMPGPFAGGPAMGGNGLPPGAAFRPGLADGPGGGAPAGGGPGGMDLVNQEGAREFLAAITEHVAPGEVISLPGGPVASLVTGYTGRWTTGGILRDVEAAGGQTSPADCAFVAEMGSGSPAGGPGRGGFGRNGGGVPQNFERVFENSFGSLWKNPADIAPLPARQAALSLTGLLVMVFAALVLMLLDWRLPPTHNRSRAVAATIGVLLAMACLTPLAQTSVDEWRNPPEPPARGRGAAFDAPPPGFPQPPQSQTRMVPPDVIPDYLRDRYDAVHRRIPEMLARGEDPRAFWAPEDELRLRRHLSVGETNEAAQLLDTALSADRKEALEIPR